MFAKTLSIAIVLSGTAGAGASYVQHNPMPPLETIWEEATTFRPPLAPKPPPVANYVRGKNYQFCRSEFREKMRKLTLTEKHTACKCFDRHFRTWSTRMQQASKVTILGKAALTMDPGKRAFSSLPAWQGSRNAPNHQSQVRASQARDQIWRIEKNFHDTVSQNGAANAFSNPLLLLAANYRIDRVVSKCGMTDRRATIHNAAKAFERIGTVKP